MQKGGASTPISIWPLTGGPERGTQIVGTFSQDAEVRKWARHERPLSDYDLDQLLLGFIFSYLLQWGHY